ncbi:MAG: post-transcriptional regulator [Sporolactobacillus sp.]
MTEQRDEFEKWRMIIAPFLYSKLHEFQLLGLNHLTFDDFWGFAKKTMEEKKEQPQHIHEIVAHVMSLSVNDYMNKLRVDVLKDNSFDLSELFRTK